MSITINNGRLGNQIFRNLVTSFIAEKQDLYVDYSNNDFFKKIGINLFFLFLIEYNYYHKIE